MAAESYRLWNPFTPMDEFLRIKNFGRPTIDPRRLKELVRSAQ